MRLRRGLGGLVRVRRRTVGDRGSLGNFVGVRRLLRRSVGVRRGRLWSAVRVRRLLWRLVGCFRRALRLFVGTRRLLGSQVGVVLSDVNAVFWRRDDGSSWDII